LREFAKSPQGFWYPRLVDRDPSMKVKRTTRFYVDFTEIPSDEMFGPPGQNP
jgi:hypothetical protein